MKYCFHPAARQDFFEALEYYEGSQQGLGAAFAKEVYATIQRILYFPEAWSKLSRNTRRCLTNRFPYGVVYHVMKEEILIVAIAQLNRKPGYWKERLKHN